MIVIQNHSTVVSDKEVLHATHACARALSHDLEPAWGLPGMPLYCYGPHSRVPRTAWPIYVLDDTDQQGDLGWHAYDGQGEPYGRVYAKTCADYGVSLSSVIAHEVFEARVDPDVNQWRGGYALEVGDPVENDSYNVALDGVLYPISNFALPNWWQPGSPGPWDWLGKTTGPLQLTPGGYAITQNGPIYGDEYPEWRKLTKLADGSRTLRRQRALEQWHD